jgi:hypothetical protein
MSLWVNACRLSTFCFCNKDDVSSSSIIDGFGKSVGEFLRARVVDLPVGLVGMEDERRAVSQKRNGVLSSASARK